MDKPNKQITPSSSEYRESLALAEKVSTIIEQARTEVVRSVNSSLVHAYWAIGREIVNEIQGGDERAEYGKQVLNQLSQQLTDRFGKGYSERNLELFRKFYLAYRQRDGISNTVCSELPDPKPNTACSESLPEERDTPHDPSAKDADDAALPAKPQIPPVAERPEQRLDPNLSWSHYRLLMRVENENARAFYEAEASRQAWSVRQLDRQIHSLFYERLLKSADKQGMLAETGETSDPLRPIDVIKDPYVLEFLDLPESHRLHENQLENALIETLQDFLLELGSGFAFVARQKRITLDGDHFYPDLIFYHIRLRCYAIIDLKVGKLDHRDLGQMQMYVNYFDREERSSEDNPTIGLVLCSEKNDALVRYVLGEGNEQIFASRYRFELPDEETLRRELERERALIQEQQNTSQDTES